MNTGSPGKGLSAAGIFRYCGGFLGLLLAGLFLASCASGGVAKAEPPIQEEQPGDFPPEESGGAEFPGAFPDDPPSTVLTPEIPAESPGPVDLIEPLFDLPEAAEEPHAPPEPPLAALPEIPAPVFPDPEPGAAGETAVLAPVETPVPVVTPPPEPAEAPAPPRIAVPLPAPPAIPPAPPPYLRPAEEYQAPPAVEPVPHPRIPDLPARPTEIPEPGIIYSRVVRATVGQLVEIPFRGTGWVYLGELGSRPGIVYGSRRLDPQGQSFIFRTEAAGTYGLKFYKQDFIHDYVLNDHVQVIVGEPPEAAAMGWFNPAIDRGRVVAEPRWPSALEEAEALGRNFGTRTAEGRDPQDGTGRAQSAAEVLDETGEGPAEVQGAASPQGGTGRAQSAAEVLGGTGEVQGAADSLAAVPGAPVVESPAPGDLRDRGPENLGPGDYPGRAREEFEAGRVASAISLLDQFRERYPSGSDEAWWLYGQFYEANSPSRDIRTALDYYRRLVREYPQSPRYNDARRRIAYLERYYINIR